MSYVVLLVPMLVVLLVVVAWQAGAISTHKKALQAFREVQVKMIQTNDLAIRAMEGHMRVVEMFAPKDKETLS